MNEELLLQAARYVGLVGVGLLVASGVGGMLMAARTFRGVKGLQGKLFKWHRVVSLAGATLFLFHPIPMLFAPRTTGGMTLEHVLVPFDAPRQAFTIGLGTLAAYALIVVTVTSLNIKRVGRARWRLLHYGTYAVVFLGLAHGLFISGEFKAGELFEPDEPEKLILLVLAAIAATLPVWRVVQARRTGTIGASG